MGKKDKKSKKKAKKFSQEPATPSDDLSHLPTKARYREGMVKLTPKFLDAICDLMQAELEMFPLNHWGVCLIGDLSIQYSLGFLYQGKEEMPELEELRKRHPLECIVIVAKGQPDIQVAYGHGLVS